MDLLNMKKWPQIFIFQAAVLKFSDIIGLWKLATKAQFSTISPKCCLLSQINTRILGINTTITPVSVFFQEYFGFISGGLTSGLRSLWMTDCPLSRAIFCMDRTGHNLTNSGYLYWKKLMPSKSTFSYLRDSIWLN